MAGNVQAGHKSAVGNRVQALRVIHPFPTLVNVCTTAALGALASGGQLSLPALFRLMAAMLAIQAAIGTINDLADRDLDAAGGRSKPLVVGALTVSCARMVAALAIVASVILSAGFGLSSWLLAMGGLACGLSYDCLLKRTVFSVVPYMIGLPLLPLWVWVSLGRFKPELLGLIPLGFLLALSLHLANSLLDFDSDKSAGVRGFAQLLGKRKALATCWISFALTLVLTGMHAAVQTGPATLQFIAAGGASACLVLAVAGYRHRPGREALQFGWGLLACGSALLAVSWLSEFAGH